MTAPTRQTDIQARELTSNNIYDAWASTYGDKNPLDLFDFPRLTLLERYLRPADICLDVGIANGISAIPLSKKVREIYGVDISPHMIEECRYRLERETITNVYPFERSATNLLFPEAFFDFVYSFATLVLVPEPEQAYREIARVLKPGGYALLDITGKLNISQIYWDRYYKKHGHWGVNAYRLPEIKDIFMALNFEIVETHASGLLDQWKYIPLIKNTNFLNKVFHSDRGSPDLDYRISQLLPAFANRWLFVVRKKIASKDNVSTKKDQ